MFLSDGWPRKKERTGQLRWRPRCCPPKSCFSVAEAARYRWGREGHIPKPGECGNRAVQGSAGGHRGRMCACQQLFRGDEASAKEVR